MATALCASMAVAKATIATFEVPGSTHTFAWAINGSTTGYYYDSGGIAHGFVRGSDGTITSFDPKGAVDTEAYGTNGAGTATGWYVESDGAAHGFMRTSDGKFISFDPSD